MVAALAQLHLDVEKLRKKGQHTWRRSVSDCDTAEQAAGAGRAGSARGIGHLRHISFLRLASAQKGEIALVDGAIVLLLQSRQLALGGKGEKKEENSRKQRVSSDANTPESDCAHSHSAMRAPRHCTVPRIQLTSTMVSSLDGILFSTASEESAQQRRRDKRNGIGVSRPSLNHSPQRRATRHPLIVPLPCSCLN